MYLNNYRYRTSQEQKYIIIDNFSNGVLQSGGVFFFVALKYCHASSL